MRLVLNKNQKRIPIGGHQFPEHGRVFSGETMNEVVQKLRDHRIRNGLSIGNPERDVINHYAKNWPYMVTQDDRLGDYDDKEDQGYLDWVAWIQKTWKNPPQKIITTKQAELRWGVCKSCKFNTDINYGDSEESISMKRRVFMMRRGAAVPDYLKFCSCHKAPLSFFCFIEDADKFSAAKDGEEFDGCWLDKNK